MARYRSRSRSFSPRRYSRSPPRRNYYDDPRDRRGGGRRDYGDRRSSAPSGLLIRNIALDARPEDLRIPFERFGPVKDVYLPKNYYTGYILLLPVLRDLSEVAIRLTLCGWITQREPRGFGFVKFRYAEDAAVAKQHMNHQILGGREISIVYAEENRKTPQEMRTVTRISERNMEGRYSRSSLSRSPRRRYCSYSRSPTPPRHESRDNGRSSKDNNYSRPRSISPSPQNDRDYRSHDRRDNERDYRSHHQSPSPAGNGRSPSRS